jgi:hypothetical protein
MRSALLPVLLAAAWAAASPAGARKQPLPHRAAIEVTAAPRVGETTLREDVAAEVAADLRERGCLAGVEPAGSTGGDLRVRVHLEELTSETTWGTSLAQSVSPNAPPDARESRTARVRAILLVTLETRPDGGRVAERRLTVDVKRTPRMLGEDAETAARDEALEQIGDRVGGVVCRSAARAPRP